MAITTSTDLQSLLKDDLRSALELEVNDEVPLFKLLGEKKIQGKREVFPVYLQDAPTATAVGETTIPDAGNEIEVDSVVNTIRVRDAFQLSDELIKRSKGAGAAAFKEALEQKMEGVKRSLVNSLGRQIFGYRPPAGSRTGVLCVVDGAAGPTTTITVHGASGSTEPGTRFLVPGMKLRIGTGADLLTNGGASDYCVVASVTSHTVFETTQNITVADGDFVVMAASNLENAYGKEMTGLDYIVSDSGTIQTIDPATYPQWTSTVIDASVGGLPGPMSLELLQRAAHKINQRSGVTPDIAIMHPSLWREIQVEVLGSYRYGNQGQKAEALIAPEGVMAMLGGKPTRFMIDRFCNYGKVFLLSSKHLQKVHLGDNLLSWLETNGQILQSMATVGSAAWMGTIQAYVNLAARRRRPHGVVTNIAYTEDYSSDF